MAGVHVVAENPEHSAAEPPDRQPAKRVVEEQLSDAAAPGGGLDVQRIDLTDAGRLRPAAWTEAAHPLDGGSVDSDDGLGQR